MRMEPPAVRSGLTRSELEPLVVEGLTIEAIAQRVGFSDSTVRKWLKRHGLRTRAAQRRATLSNMHRAGDRDIELECRKHGLARHVSGCVRAPASLYEVPSRDGIAPTTQSEGAAGRRGRRKMRRVWLRATFGCSPVSSPRSGDQVIWPWGARHHPLDREAPCRGGEVRAALCQLPCRAGGWRGRATAKVRLVDASPR